MMRGYMKTIVAALASVVIAGPCLAQNSIREVLSSVERNNAELAEIQKNTEALQLSYKAERTLDAPEIGFDYLWGSPADIGNRKDISVTQSFDFATLTGAKKKLWTSRSDLALSAAEAQRQQLLLRAKILCINVIYCNILDGELSERLKSAAEAEKTYKDMFEHGEVDRTEVAKAHAAYLSQKNAYDRNHVAREGYLAELCALNGGEEVALEAVEYGLDDLGCGDFETWYASASEKSPELAAAKSNVSIGQYELKSNKMSILPTITAGYMAELVKGSNFRGLTMGLSIPIWSAKSKVRQSNLQKEASVLAQTNTENRIYNKYKGLYNNTLRLKSIRDELNASLQTYSESLEISEKKLSAGEISILDSILEKNMYYSIVDEALAADRDYYLSLAELLVWDL